MWAVWVPVWLASVSVMQAETPAPAVQASAEAAPVESIEAAPVRDSVDVIDPVAEATIVEPVEEGTKRWYSLTASFTHASLLIIDDDWSNDHYTVTTVGGTVDLTGSLKGFARVGVSQFFVTGGSRGLVEARELEVGVSMPQELSLAGLGWPRTLDLTHRFTLTLPTSDQALDRDLIMAPDLRTSGSLTLPKGFSVSGNARVQYRWHRYAEFPDRIGMLPQLLTGLGMVLEYSAPTELVHGELTASVGGTRGWTKKHASRDGQDSWEHPLSAELDVSYAYEELSWLTASASLAWGANILREGASNITFLNRDETELSFTIAATY